jgi:hypothetical protein
MSANLILGQVERSDEGEIFDRAINTSTVSPSSDHHCDITSWTTTGSGQPPDRMRRPARNAIYNGYSRPVLDSDPLEGLRETRPLS